MATFNLNINGSQQTVEAESDMPLLWVLRDLLKLTGTKFGCGIGMCGACIVHIDGEAKQSCLLPVSSIGSREVITIEGLAIESFHKVQQTWIDESVAQCGYCQPGKIMNTVALLNKNPHPTDEEIDSAFENHLCRCGTYQRIRYAIHKSAEGG